MVNLPAEVLTLVLYLLDQRDQMEFMTVCRQWHKISNLFRVIYIDKQQQLDQLIEIVKRDSILGTNVKRLTLQLRLDLNYDAKILVDLFPNLRDFAIINSNYSSSDNKSITPRQSHPWCERIEKMVEDSSDINTITLLYSGLCRNLTYISVVGQKENARNLIARLINAPALEKLYLKSYAITFNDLELLHSNSPLIDSLSLDDIEFYDTIIPLNIEPATLLKAFSCFSCDSTPFEGPNPHLPYILQKYTHIEELDLQLEWLGNNETDWGLGENENEGEFATGQRAMFISYIKILAPRLKTLSLSLHDFDVDILDECECHIKKLSLDSELSFNILTRLSETTQAQSIQSLSLSFFDEYFNPYHLLKKLIHFKILKELTLEYIVALDITTNIDLNLNDLLENLSEIRLETLRLYNVNLEHNHLSKAPIYPPLKSLTLFRNTFGKGADVCISQIFPNLKHLKLDNCLQENETFMLPNTSLSNLEIITTVVNRASPILLITLRNNQQRLYRTSTKPSLFRYYRNHKANHILPLPYISSQPFGESKDSPVLTIVCKSVWNFIMINTEEEPLDINPE